MSNKEPNITIPIDLTNPGQFFACRGLLELVDRTWPGAEGWFEGGLFMIAGSREYSLRVLLGRLAESAVANTMTPAQNARLEELTAMTKKQREATAGLDDEKKSLESLRRELPIVLTGVPTRERGNKSNSPGHQVTPGGLVVHVGVPPSGGPFPSAA